MLDGKLVCLENGQEITAKGRNFTIGYLMDCDYNLADDSRAERIHCQIDCDPFGHVTIYNKSEKNPISVNGEIVNIKRTLFNNSKIKILDKEFLWQHNKASTYQNVPIENLEVISTPDKQIGIPEQPPSSCPSLRYHRDVPKRFTMHNLRAFRIDNDENQSLDESESDISSHISEDPLITLDTTPAKVDVVDSTSDKKTSSTEKRRTAFRNMCGWSGMTTTSYSPRETGVRVEKTFTAIIPPTTSHSSLCRTPKGVLERLHLHSNGNIADKKDIELISFATPTKKADNGQIQLIQHPKSAMKIIDLTTPIKLRAESPLIKSGISKRLILPKNEKDDKSKTRELSASILINTPKITISEMSSSSASTIIVDSSEESDNSTVVAVTSTTPLRTPLPTTQSSALRKHVLLASARNQVPPTPHTSINASTSARNTTISTPLTTERKGRPITSVTSSVSSSKSFVASTVTKNPPNRRLKVDSPGTIQKKSSTRTLNEKFKLFDTSQKNEEETVSPIPNTLTTSTPYKHLTIDKPEEESVTKLFNNENKHENDNSIAELKEDDDQPKVENDDDLLKEIEEILSTSDELKKQLRDTKCNDEEEDDDEEGEEKQKLDKQAEMQAMRSQELAKEIEDVIECTSTTKVKQCTTSVKCSLTASILLKAINSTTKINLSCVNKEDEEKENQINVGAATPTAVRRRISISTPDVIAHPNTSVEEVGVGGENTPLTPKRITRRRSSISLDRDEVTATNITQRNIDHYNTENMGAIVEEVEEAQEDALVQTSVKTDDATGEANAPNRTLNMTITRTYGKQIKGGYLLRYKKQLFWNRWAEEFVVLYDDSTMAWFTEPGRSSPAGKILVKEAPEMLAIAQWTGQIPRRPPLPEGCSVSQLIALGSQRKRSKVYWMLAKSEQEVSEWIDAITKTLPPPPQIELVVDKPHLMNVLRRPLVRIRPATTSEVKQRKALGKSTSSSLVSTRLLYNQNPLVKSDAAVAILSKKPDSRASLACMLPWGHGWGWATLPNGVWSGGLTWSQCEDTFTLHALPTTHCTNLIDTPCSGAVYHTDMGGFDFHSSGGVEDLGGEDFDYAMDCGDFIF